MKKSLYNSVKLATKNPKIKKTLRADIKVKKNTNQEGEDRKSIDFIRVYWF